MIKQEKITWGVVAVILIADTEKQTFTILNTAYRNKEGKKEPSFTFKDSKSIGICLDVASCLRRAIARADELFKEQRSKNKID